MSEQTLTDDVDLTEDTRVRPSRLTIGLVCAIAAVLVFTGGAVVQKHWGAPSAAPAGPAGFSGARAGGYGPAGAVPRGTTGSGGATPVVVGTVSRLTSSRMIVRNLGGKSVTVELPAGVTVSLVKQSRLPSLAKGATVSVAGRAASDGTVTATSVTVR